MTILNLPTFTEQTEKTPEQKLLESLQQMQIERPSVPAAEVPRFTRYGNRMAERGGFGVLPQEQLSGMTQQQVDEYERQRKQARRSGVSETLLRMGQAFQGMDASGLALERQQARQAQQQKAEQEELLKQFADDPRYADMIKLYRAGLDPRLAAGTPKTGSVERFTLYDKITGKPVRTILKSEAENIDRTKFIVGPLADPFANGKVDDDIETWAVTDRDGNRAPDLINPTEEEIKSVVAQGYFLNKTPQLTSAGKAKDIGEIKGWNDQNGLEKRAISYNTLVNTGQRIINNLYENPESVLATGDIAQVFDQIGQEFKAAGVLINQEEKTKFVNNTDPKIRNAITELASQTAITESQLLDFAYQIAKVRGQEGRGLSDQDFRNFQKIISAGRTADQKASVLYEFITGVGSEIKSELDYTRELKNLTLGRNPQDREANAIITGINDLYTVGFGKIDNPFIQQPAPTTPTTQTTDGIPRVRIKL